VVLSIFQVFFQMPDDKTQMKQVAALQEKRQLALTKLAGATGTQSEFLHTAIEALAEGLDCHVAAVGEANEDQSKVHLLVMRKAGKFVEPYTYDLTGTPCEDLYTSTEAEPHIHHCEGLCDLFPQDEALVHLGAEGYRAEAFHDAGGNRIGHVFIIDNKPTEDNVDEMVFFRLVSQRIGAEINRWRAETARQTSELQQLDLLNNTSSVIYIKDLDGRYQFINRRFEELFHTSIEALGGKTDHDLFSVEKADIFRANDLCALKSAQPLEIEEIVPQDDGVHTYISVKFPLKDAAGEPSAICGISTDITERKWAEGELIRSEASLQNTKQLLENAIQSFSDGFALFDSEDRFVLANEHYLTSHQVVRDVQVPGVKFEDIVRELANVGFYGNSPDEIEEWINLRLEKYRTGESFEYQMTDGHWYQVNQYQTKDGGKSIVRTDITSIKAAEESRLEAENRFRAIVDNSSSPIFFKDTEGRFLIANQQHKKSFGAKGNDLIGKTSQPFVSDEEYQAVMQQDQEVMQTRKVVAKLHAFDGREFLTTKFPVFDAQGKMLGLGGIDTDISELRQAEKALAESEARFRAFAEASSDWFWESDAKGRMAWQSEIRNAEAVYMHGSVIGKTREEIAGDQASNTDWTPYNKAIGSHLEFKDFEYRYEGADGKSVYARISGSPVFSIDGEFLGHRGVASNVTEIREAEDLLRRAQKMEAVGQLTGGIAHDFNNLMAVMVGHAEILADTVGDDRQASESVAAIIRSVERGSSLTSRLLAFSRQQSLSPVVANVEKLITGLEDMLRRTLGEATELKVKSDPDTWFALIDPHQFDNALLNLAINARDAMPDGGMLVIETANVSFDSTYANAQDEVAAGDYVEVAISDTGSGMAANVLEKVFEPFFTTKEIGKGSGLGLSMVYGFVKQSNGHVTIYSEEGHGTTVKLFLPRTTGSDNVRDADEETAKPARGSERILVVEDDAGVRAVSVSMLRTQGYEIVEAENGAEALSLLQEGQRFELLFTDVILPGGINGVEIAKTAKKLQPDIKVLYTTGYAENGVMQSGKLDTGMEVVNKPYRRNELLDKVRAALDSGTESQA
jgi:PAS domain S-box-containing protein